MGDEGEYVNELPKGYSENWPQCDYEFQLGYPKHGFEVKAGQRCGLPADRDMPLSQKRCPFHAPGGHRTGKEFSQKLESTAKHARYLGEAQLEEADLHGVCLTGAMLPYARLHRAILDDARLQGAKLYRADLEHASLLRSDLSGAYLAGAQLQYADLREAKLHGASLNKACLRNADLRTAVLGALPGGGDVDLVQAHLEGALVSGARVVPTANLAAATWGEPWGRRWSEYHLQDERLLRVPALLKCDPRLKRGGPPLSFADCANIYHELRIAYQRTSEQERESAFYIREMECRRARVDGHLLVTAVGWWRTSGARRRLPLRIRRWSGHWRRWWRRRKGRLVHRLACRAMGVALTIFLLIAAILAVPLNWRWPRNLVAASSSWLMYYVAGYGELPSRVLGWALGVVLLFASVQGCIGIDKGAAPIAIQGCEVVRQDEAVVGPGWDWPWKADMRQWGHAVYFSVVTFTTLGYGDLTPKPGLGQFCAGVEALLGFVLLSLFLVCVVRKFSR